MFTNVIEPAARRRRRNFHHGDSETLPRQCGIYWVEGELGIRQAFHKSDDTLCAEVIPEWRVGIFPTGRQLLSDSKLDLGFEEKVFDTVEEAVDYGDYMLEELGIDRCMVPGIYPNYTSGGVEWEDDEGNSRNIIVLTYVAASVFIEEEFVGQFVESDEPGRIIHSALGEAMKHVERCFEEECPR
jgi:hypothetical protein